jgi:tyrosyl-tRNA synthetase
MDKPTIEDIMSAHNEARANRLAQKHLAYEVTKIVHGEERAKSIQVLSETLFGGSDYLMLTAADFRELQTELKTVSVKYNSDLAEVIVEAELASSKGEARRFLNSSAIYINGSQLSLEKTNLAKDDFVDGFAVIRRGKNANALVQLKV